MLHALYFSPSGTTEKTARLIAGSIGMPVECHDITLTAPEALELADDDAVLFAAPVYAGRIPPMAAERLAALKGAGQKAVVVAVYGNRDYDDALLELCDIALGCGFDVVGAGAFIAQHCIFPKVAAGRPDSDDELRIAEFGQLAAEALSCGTSLNLARVKGNRPYKPMGAVPLHPGVDKGRCNGCGRCASQCPAGAIDRTSPQVTDAKRCISCCRCMAVCPNGARRFGGVLYKVAGFKFVRDNSRRLEPEWIF